MNKEDFYKELEKNPADWELRGVFADWLYDHNDILEKAQRYMIEHKKHPFVFNISCGWSNEKEGGPLHSDLPFNILDKLSGYARRLRNMWKFYDSLQDAELDLSKWL